MIPATTPQDLAERTAAPRLLNKVPEVTLAFWAIKIMATTVGETAADYLNVHLHLGLGGTSVLMATLLAVVLTLQVRARRYQPALYWLTVVLVSVVGTLITDNLTDHLGVPLAVSTAVFAVALAGVFAVWYARERTLSIHHIDTRSRELWYWLAILTTFALGTAAGDGLAEGLALGYLNSALLFGGAIALIALARYGFGANAVASFWLAYILTRPFGASVGDWLSQPAASGGLGLGTTVTSALFLVAMLGLVGAMQLNRSAGRN
jgi:uncharacterized membrane-anchored protein